MLNKLKKNIPLIVGGDNEKKFFEHFFEQVFMVESNSLILSLYKKRDSTIIFLDYNEKNSLDIIKQIRKKDREIVISLLITDITHKECIELLSLHLSGYIQRPYNLKELEKLFKENILVDLNYLKKGRLKLKSNYIFDTEQQMLYNDKEFEVKLTKHELQLIKLFLESKNNFLTTEFLEYSIWEEASSMQSCNNRLKYLMTSIRKKLPKNTLINTYGLGYKLAFDT